MDADWWQVLLGGLIGSVLGGLATLAGVVLVIRHERQQRSSDVVDDTMMSLLAECCTRSLAGLRRAAR